MFKKPTAVIHHIKDLIQGLVLPFTCIFCKRPTRRLQDLCQSCLEDLPIVTQKCFRCARKLALSGQKLLCGTCMKHPPPFAMAYSLFAYEEPIIRLILDLKFHRQLVYARILGELMAEKIRESWYCNRPLPELLVPVPLHSERLKARGYNQALEIAKPIARILGIKVETKAIKRIKNTPAQINLPAEKRAQNLKNAFVFEGRLTGKNIAILDDVITTGSTMTALGHALLEKGAGQIEAWCCARR